MPGPPLFCLTRFNAAFSQQPRLSQFLQEQLEDVKASRRELMRVIRAVDREIVTIFSAAFDDVSRHFTNLFATLFPGGAGRLRLTDDVVWHEIGRAEPRRGKAELRAGMGDIDYGQWQMRTHAEVEEEAPQAWHLWRHAPHLVRFPGGESFTEMQTRITTTVDRLVTRHSGGVVVAVSQATRASGSSRMIASRIASLTWSHILSG